MKFKNLDSLTNYTVYINRSDYYILRQKLQPIWLAATFSDAENIMKQKPFCNNPLISDFSYITSQPHTPNYDNITSQQQMKF